MATVKHPFELVIERDGDRYRLIRSKGGDGIVYYEDGRNPADRKEAPWLDHCKVGPAASCPN